MNNRILVTVVFVTIYCVFIRLFVGKYNPSWYQASWISGWPENKHVRLNCSPLLIEVSCIDCTNFGTDSRNKEKLIDVKSYWINDKSLQKKMKFSNKDIFSKCDQIHTLLRIWSHLLKKSLMRNFIFCASSYKSLYTKFQFFLFMPQCYQRSCLTHSMSV